MSGRLVHIEKMCINCEGTGNRFITLRSLLDHLMTRPRTELSRIGETPIHGCSLSTSCRMIQCCWLLLIMRVMCLSCRHSTKHRAFLHWKRRLPEQKSLLHHLEEREITSGQCDICWSNLCWRHRKRNSNNVRKRERHRVMWAYQKRIYLGQSGREDEASVRTCIRKRLNPFFIHQLLFVYCTADWMRTI